MSRERARSNRRICFSIVLASSWTIGPALADPAQSQDFKSFAQGASVQIPEPQEAVQEVNQNFVPTVLPRDFPLADGSSVRDGMLDANIMLGNGASPNASASRRSTLADEHIVYPTISAATALEIEASAALIGLALFAGALVVLRPRRI